MVYLGIVMVGLLDAMDSLEQAVVRAVVGKQRGSCPRSGANSPCYANRKEVVVNNPCVDWRRRLRYHLGWMVNVVKVGWNGFLANSWGSTCAAPAQKLLHSCVNHT